jgi:hypothetical protein
MTWIFCALASNSCLGLRASPPSACGRPFRGRVDLVNWRAMSGSMNASGSFGTEIAPLLGQIGLVPSSRRSRRTAPPSRRKALLLGLVGRCNDSSALFISFRFARVPPKRASTPRTAAVAGLHAEQQQPDLFRSAASGFWGFEPSSGRSFFSRSSASERKRAHKRSCAVGRAIRWPASGTRVIVVERATPPDR